MIMGTLIMKLDDTKDSILCMCVCSIIICDIDCSINCNQVASKCLKNGRCFWSWVNQCRQHRETREVAYSF